MAISPCSFTLATPARSTSACPGCLTVHAKGLACDLVTLRCVLDGHVEVPHLTDAEEDRYSSLFKDVDVGTAWRSCVISEMQGPIYLGCFSVCKSELRLGRDVLIGDEVLLGFDGLSKTLDCMPAAHGSGSLRARPRRSGQQACRQTSSQHKTLLKLQKETKFC